MYQDTCDSCMIRHDIPSFHVIFFIFTDADYSIKFTKSVVKKVAVDSHFNFTKIKYITDQEFSIVQPIGAKF